jgi:hypothetical protein
MADPREPVPEGVPRLDFVVPGFGKCGTTSLCAMLALHPQVFIPAAKELWFFSLPNYRDGWPQFSAHFRHAQPGQKLGEGSTAYLALDEGEAAAQALARHYPECRVLILARDPVERLLSSYREMHHSGHLFGLECPFSLSQALDAMPRLFADSLYWQRSAPYRALFAPEQIRVLFFEDMRRDPTATLKQACLHIGVEPAHLQLPEAGLHLNLGESKLRDTRLLRLLKRQRVIARWLRAMEPGRREAFLMGTRLRRPIGPLAWPPELLSRLRERLGEDARQFLTHYGKPEDFWPGVAP